MEKYDQEFTTTSGIEVKLKKISFRDWAKIIDLCTKLSQDNVEFVNYELAAALCEYSLPRDFDYELLREDPSAIVEIGNHAFKLNKVGE